MSVVRTILTLYLYVLFARFILDWVLVLARSFRPQGAVAVIFEVVFSLTDPPLKFLRRFIPPLRIGNFALDLSFILLLIGLRAVIGALPA